MIRHGYNKKNEIQEFSTFRNVFFCKQKKLKLLKSISPNFQPHALKQKRHYKKTSYINCTQLRDDQH